MKIVIITGNFYPFLGPRSHRATELALELSKRNYQVIVYTLMGDFDYTSFTETTNIIVKRLGKKNNGLKQNDNTIHLNLFKRILIKLFKRKLQYPFIKLKNDVHKALLNEEDINCLITIVYPHPINWGVSKFINKYGKSFKWIADSGDPFMKNPIESPPFYFKRYEKRWCAQADFITVPINEAKAGYYREFQNKIRVIPQGFSFDNFKLFKYKKNKIPTFAYSGIFYRSSRNPNYFLEWLSNLNINYKFIVYTRSHILLEPFLNKFGDRLVIKDYIPRDELIFELSKCDVLLNFTNKSHVQIPSKLIDYYTTKRPIVEIDTDFTEKQNFLKFLKGEYVYQNKTMSSDLEKFNIINVVDSFEELFK